MRVSPVVYSVTNIRAPPVISIFVILEHMKRKQEIAKASVFSLKTRSRQYHRMARSRYTPVMRLGMKRAYRRRHVPKRMTHKLRIPVMIR